MTRYPLERVGSLLLTKAAVSGPAGVVVISLLRKCRLCGYNALVVRLIRWWSWRTRCLLAVWPTAYWV